MPGALMLLLALAVATLASYVALDLARRVRVVRTRAGGLWLFHHKPGRTDEQLVRIRSDARRVFAATETASEGEQLAL